MIVNVENSLDVDTLLATGFLHEDGVPEPGLLTICHLTLAIHVPDVRSQGLGYVWSLLHEGIPNCVGGCAARCTSCFSWRAEKKTHNVRLIRMEELAAHS
jgi:hypothetical protein